MANFLSELPESEKQAFYRDARFTKTYDGVWQSMGKCVFCDLRDKYIVLEENGIVLTVTLYAYIDGHMMIIPRRHVESPKELTPEEWETVRKFMYLSKKMIKKVHGVAGLQYIQKDGRSADSTVGHIHYHAVPFDAPDLAQWNYRKLENTPAENAEKYRALGKNIKKMSRKYDEKYSAGIADDEQDPFNFDWADFAFASKKPISRLKATFIAAPREISAARFTQLVKTYLPMGNIVVGLAKEDYIDGFENQPQFRTLKAKTIQSIIDKVNTNSPDHKIYTLSYFQREANYLLEKIDFQKVILINGSWHRSFHTRSEYYTLVQRGVSYELISPFTDEDEAKQYEATTTAEIEIPKNGAVLSEIEMMQVARDAAKGSYDYSFQTGVALGKKTAKGYRLLETSFNKVVPYQTYAMHHGASRERNFSPPHDLNHYDAVHAEVEMILKAGKQGIDLKGTTLFINLLPCPSCARMFVESDIGEFVYSIDHSSGMAHDLLVKAGKTVRRLTST